MPTGDNDPQGSGAPRSGPVSPTGCTLSIATRGNGPDSRKRLCMTRVHRSKRPSSAAVTSGQKLMRRVSVNRLLGSPIADVGGVHYEYPTTVGLSDEISGTHSV
jgi:hypothetical protein